MDIHKLEVDESQINKATGRIILPDKETPSPARSHPVPARAAAPRITGQPGTAGQHAARPNAVHAASAVPAASSLPASPPPQSMESSSRGLPQVSWTGLMAGGIFLILGVFLLLSIWWTHTQQSRSLETLRMESIRLQSQLDKAAQSVQETRRDLGDLRVALTEIRSELRTQWQSQNTTLLSLQDQLMELETVPAFTPPVPSSNFSLPQPTFSTPSTVPAAESSLAP